MPAHVFVIHHVVLTTRSKSSNVGCTVELQLTAFSGRAAHPFLFVGPDHLAITHPIVIHESTFSMEGASNGPESKSEIEIPLQHTKAELSRANDITKFCKVGLRRDRLIAAPLRLVA
jgi:hypothetical protein